MKNTALIIDDDRNQRRMIARILSSQLDLATIEAQNGQEGLALLKQHSHIKLIITDLNMPVMDGHETLSYLVRDHPNIPVLVLTGSSNLNEAIEIMKKGAYDFLSKPIEQERLVVSARNGLKSSLMSQEISRLKRQHDKIFHFTDLIGHNTGLQPSIKLAKKAATSNIPVLITGETGTGKEVFARAIHGESARAQKPFVAINCGAIPEKLIESTLFGHEKGSFTGAIQKALGKFQEADGGTLFLDEIGELPLEAQVRLLRVLQQKEVEPVGANKPINIDVRVMSATNRDLSLEVKEGRFREDLYFRLNILPIKLPALRKRQIDVQNLADHFIQLFCASNQASKKTLADKAMVKLQQYEWPGNVRELENMINRAMVLCDYDVIGEDDLMFEDSNNNRAEPEPGLISLRGSDGNFKPFKELEHEIINQALQYNNHNITQTARILGIAKSTLYAKITPEKLDQVKSA